MTIFNYFSFLIYTAVLVNLICAKKILLFCGPTASHFREINGVGVVLLERKHDVHMLIATTIMKNAAADLRYKLITYDDNKMVVVNEETGKKWINEMALNSSPLSMMQILYENGKIKFPPLCNNTIGNKELLERLSKENYDLVIIDSLSLMLCFHLLPDYLNVSHVALGSEIRLSSTRLVEPFLKTLSSKSTLGRLSSYLVALLLENLHYLFFNYDALSEAVGHKYQNVDRMAEKSKLWLLNHDFLLQPPQSIPPHVRMVGGLSLQKWKPLEEIYQTFVDGAKEGFVVFTFGSMMAYFPREVAVKFAKAFELIQGMRVVMRMKGDDEIKLFKNHNNVMINSWLPQNDLLAHKNCKLFISHCGNNGQFEALFHAIPILGFPLFGDQRQNAERIQNRGYGLSYKLSDFTAEDLAKNILHMSRDNSSYKLKIAAASRIYRRQSPAQERAADAVEEVLRSESHFYYPEDDYKLSAWNYNHLDLFLLIFCGVQAVVLICLSFMWICLKWVCRRIKARQGKCKIQ